MGRAGLRRSMTVVLVVAGAGSCGGVGQDDATSDVCPPIEDSVGAGVIVEEVSALNLISSRLDDTWILASELEPVDTPAPADDLRVARATVDRWLRPDDPLAIGGGDSVEFVVSSPEVFDRPVLNAGQAFFALGDWPLEDETTLPHLSQVIWFDDDGMGYVGVPCSLTFQFIDRGRGPAELLVAMIEDPASDLARRNLGYEPPPPPVPWSERAPGDRMLGADDMPAELAADLDERAVSVQVPPSWSERHLYLCSAAALGRNPCEELAGSATQAELRYHQSRSDPFPVTFFVFGMAGWCNWSSSPRIWCRV